MLYQFISGLIWNSTIFFMFQKTLQIHALQQMVWVQPFARDEFDILCYEWNKECNLSQFCF